MTDEAAVSSIPHGEILMDLVGAVHGGDAAEMAAARRTVRENMGDAAFVDACATIASFSAVVKIADGAGIPLEDYKEEATRDMRVELSINDFQS